MHVTYLNRSRSDVLKCYVKKKAYARLLSGVRVKNKRGVRVYFQFLHGIFYVRPEDCVLPDNNSALWISKGNFIKFIDAEQSLICFHLNGMYNSETITAAKMAQNFATTFRINNNRV